jgi:hypothetical protein
MNQTHFDRTTTPTLDGEAYARKLERLSWLMDRAVTVPGTKVSVGLDALLGLFPGIGDFLTGLVQAGLVLGALSRYKVPKEVAVKMMANVLIDIGVGIVPFLGDLFDVAFKANTRNVKLLQPYVPGLGFAKVKIPEPEPVTVGRWIRGTLWRYLIPIGLVLVLVLALVLIGTITVFRWLLGAEGFSTPGRRPLAFGGRTTDRRPAELILAHGLIVDEDFARTFTRARFARPNSPGGPGGTTRGNGVIVFILVRGALDPAGNPRERRFSRLRRFPTGGHRPSRSEARRFQIILFVFIKQAAVTIRGGPRFVVEFDATASQQVPRIVEPGGQIAVIQLFADQAILDRAVVGLELGDLFLKLLVLKLGMSQARLELAGRRPAGQEIAATRASRHAGQDQGQ